MPHPPRDGSVPQPRKKLYGERNSLLKAMGFCDYGAYLKSTKWRLIRKWVVRLFGPGCSFCNNRSVHVHHASYCAPTLEGSILDHLYPICKQCHDLGEFFPDGGKRDPQQATEEMLLSCRSRMGDDWCNQMLAHRLAVLRKRRDNERKSGVVH